MDVSAVTYNSKAVRLSRQLMQDIDSGLWSPGTLLPSQIELAGKYQVSRDAVQRALSILDEQGKVLRLGQGRVQVPLVSGRGQDDLSVSVAGGTIAAIWAAEPDYHVVECRKGIARYAAEHGLEFKIFLSSGGHEQTLGLFETARDQGIDGLLVFPYTQLDYVRAIRRLIEQDVPLVCMDRLVQGISASCVHFDNASGMYEATHYLIEKYSQPVYYVSNLPDHSTLIADYEGYQHAMADAGLASFVSEYSCLGRTGDGDPRFWALGKKWMAAKDSIDQFFEKAVFPASVVCSNDYVAQGIYDVAALRQLKIGDDIHVVGFGDYPLGRFLSPSLTTVHAPMYQMGYEAAKLLHQTIQKKLTTPVQLHLPVELVVRDSA